jgi:hypothetical protein
MIDLPWASLEQNRDIVKPISALSLTGGFAEEDVTGHGVVVRALISRCKTSAAWGENPGEYLLKKCDPTRIFSGGGA